MHGAKDEDADEQPVQKPKESVGPTPDVVEGGYQHGYSTHEREPPSCDIDTSASAHGLPENMTPASFPYPIHYEQCGVKQHAQERQFPENDVIQQRTLEGDTDR